MNKVIIFCFAILLLTTELEAQRYSWGQRCCRGCRRYMDLTVATYDGDFFGYVDNINYQDPYCLPLNLHFYRPCCRQKYDYQYLLRCIQSNRTAQPACN